MRYMRGFTLAETIVAIFIFGLMLSAIATLTGPIVNAPGQEAAKSDTLMSAAYGLDTIERDIRQSDVTGIFACTKAGTVTCSQPTSLTATPYLAVLTAYNASGIFQTGPSWQAFVVYSQPAGSAIIYRTYQSWSGSPVTRQLAAVSAVTAASALPTGTTIAIPTAQSMSIGVNATGEIDFQLATASSSGDASNSTRYTTTILARN